MARDKAKPVVDHVQELISRLRIIILLLTVTSVVAFPYSPQVLNFLQSNLLPKEWKLIVTDPTEAVVAELLISFIIGLIISFPIILYEIIKFVGPALMLEERKFATYFILGFFGLFVFGVLFAYCLLLPVTYGILAYLTQPTGASALMSLENFVSFTLIFIVSTGLILTYPVFLFLLAKIGLLSAKTLSKYRKYILAALFIIAALITPDPTPISDLILIVPVWVLYEASILAIKRIKKE